MTLSTLSTQWSRIALVVLALDVFAGAVWAQERPATKPKSAAYAVTDLGTLTDGPFSVAVGLNNNDLINGASGLADFTQHAVVWKKGLITDIAVPGLGGLNSEAFGVNAEGQAAGLAETATSDPNGEDFCGFGTYVICLPFMWQHGVMTSLPTLGGNNAEGGQINDRGQMAGNAENTTLDSTCPVGGPQMFQEKPVTWEKGKVRRLHTFPGDPDGWAFGINDHGQTVGASGFCSTLNEDTGVYILSRHALLWDKRAVTDLGNLGGTGAFGPGNVAGEINNQGEVVGTSDLKGDTKFHAFLWTRKNGMKDLGTLDGDVDSAGLGINQAGDAVGVSFDEDGDPRAFLRKNGVMADLNTLIPADSPLYLLFAHGINSGGEIVGFGVDGAGDVHAFLATPCAGDADAASWGLNDTTGATGEVGATTESPRGVLSEKARKVLQRQLRLSRFGVGLMGPR
jgi:probable HAF family extracellular repeat protein